MNHVWKGNKESKEVMECYVSGDVFFLALVNLHLVSSVLNLSEASLTCFFRQRQLIFVLFVFSFAFVRFKMGCWFSTIF